MNDGSPFESAASGSVDAEWTDLRSRLAPLIGERAFAYFAHAVSSVRGDEVGVVEFAAALRATGNDPERPQLTETESLLVDWGRASAAGTVDAALSARASAAFSPQLAALLAEGVALGATS